ncbi:hypothetical protein ACIRPH_19570 [Nocardiopsis sp. NPDC101807]|uniref:amino acid kinase family protein n=1 Tax=Nocardiopsis sp. NPDC101807 TaxID=3364339 RepID=UPI0038240000
MVPDLLAVKVGGSLFSRKDKPGDLDEGAMSRTALSLYRLSRVLKVPLVLISGGGAFGHGAIRQHDATNAFSLAGLTEATFEVKKSWAGRLRAVGFDAFPLQLAAMCVLRDGKPRLESSLLRELLDHGVLPVLSGDVLFDDDGRIHVFSSDRVPELLSPLVGGNLRVVVLTDVDGIVVDGEGGDRILPHVDAEAPQEAYAALWKSSEWDATGAMHTKLDALLTCARDGAECFIMRGEPGSDLDFLSSPYQEWPSKVKSTRITSTSSSQRK